MDDGTIINNSETVEYAEVDEQNQEELPQEPASPGGKTIFLKKSANILGNGAFYLMLLIMTALVLSVVQTRLTGAAPTLADYQMYIVQGGSMSPTFEMGSLAFVRAVEPQELSEGAIITYHSGGRGKTLTTHRIMKVHNEGSQLYFTTRGDANLVDDWLPVYPENIVGQVVFTVPYIGYLMYFSQTKAGIAALVFIPGALIAFFEARNLFRYAAEWEKEKVHKLKANIDSYSKGEK